MDMHPSHDTHNLISSLMEHGSDFVWELDAQRRYRIASAACYELLGYQPEEMLGRTPFELMLAEHRDAALAAALLREETRQPMAQVIGRYLHKQGFEVVLESNGYLLFDAQGTPRGWRGITRDVTTRELGLRRQRHVTTVMKQAQALGHFGSWEWLLDGSGDYWSEEIYRIFGYEPYSVPPSLESFRRIVHPEDTVIVADACNRAIANRADSFEAHFRIVTPQGVLRYLHLQACVNSDANGAPLSVLGTMHDVTERERAMQMLSAYQQRLELLVQQRTAELENTIRLLEEENHERRQAEKHLIEAKEEAEQANRLKSEFLSRVSHELRTPMNAILGFSQLLEQEFLNERQRDYNREILGAGTHLLQLIDEVLDLGAIEAGRLRLDIRPVALGDVLQESLALVRNLALGRQVSLHDNTQAQRPWLQADPVRLKEVLVNLLNNAIKYNRSGGTVDIDCSLRDEAWIRVSIRDSGMGVQPEHLSRLFSPFDRLDAEYSKIEGTGIGLSIVKALIEKMGGRVGVQSTPQAGTTFWFELRSAPAATTPAMRPPATGS
ncbi:MAG TPA: ATP-binding protein [Hyphomicrobiales bacterium]|nr:ATP-binding protein [Hyphomicrobiales bacterium]